MTDQVDLPEPQWGSEESWDQAAPAAVPAPAVYQAPMDTRENHIFTISITPNKPPMVVVRADTGEAMRQRLAELRDAGVYLAMAEADQQLQQAKPPVDYMQQQMGATPIGSYPTPPMPPANMGQPPFGAPPGGYQPPAPAQPAWGQGQPASAAPAGWLQVRIPFNAKAEGDALKEWLKQNRLYQGNIKWDGDNKRWLISPAIAEYFAKWNPAPA